MKRKLSENEFEENSFENTFILHKMFYKFYKTNYNYFVHPVFNFKS